MDASPAKLLNYSVTLNNGSLGITQAPLSITAADKTKIYGDGNPALTGSIVGIKNSDAITASYSTTADATTGVGSYSIVPAAVDASTAQAAQLTPVTLNNGSLGITQAPLSITAADKTKIYGDGNPALTGSIVGIKQNSDAITASATRRQLMQRPVSAATASCRQRWMLRRPSSSTTLSR